MIRYQRTQDLELVRSILTHPELYDWMGDDFTPERPYFEPNPDPRIWYLLCFDGEELLGLLMFVPQSHVLWDVHCSLLPSARGKTAEAARGAFRWMFALTHCRRIVAAVPRFNRPAAALCRIAGLKLYGVNPKAFLRRGSLHDLLLYGISKDS